MPQQPRKEDHCPAGEAYCSWNSRENDKGSCNKSKGISSASCHPLSFSIPSLLQEEGALDSGCSNEPRTPVLGWKMTDKSAREVTATAGHHKQQRAGIVPGGITVSARKLAATLWGMEEIRNTGAEMQEEVVQDWNMKHTTTLQGQSLGDNYAIQKSLRRPSLQYKGGNGPIRHSQFSTQPAEIRQQRRRLPENPTRTRNRQAKVVPNGSPRKMGSDAGETTARGSVIDIRKASSEIENGVTVPSELLKVLDRISHLEEKHASSMSAVDTLRAELDHAQTQVRELLHEQKIHRKEIENITKRLACEKPSWLEHEQETIMEVVRSIKEELEDGKKSRVKLELLHKRVIRELSEAKITLANALQDVQKEREARELMEDACNELTRQIREGKAKVEKWKLESAKVKEEIEEERKMLQIADVWREERVQMKLTEARLELEEKNMALDKVRSELEAFLRSKLACDVRQGAGLKELGRGRSSVDAGQSSEIKITARNSIDSTCLPEIRVPFQPPESRWSLDSTQLNEAKLAGWIMADANHSREIGVSTMDSIFARETRAGICNSQEPGNDAFSYENDDDLHSIELNRDTFVNTTGSSHLGYHHHHHHEIQMNGRRSTDGIVQTIGPEGRWKFHRVGIEHELERSSSSPLGSGHEVVQSRKKDGRLIYMNESHGRDGISEKSEGRGWKREIINSMDAKMALNSPWQSHQEEMQDHMKFTARALERNFQGHTDSLARSGIIQMECGNSRTELDAQHITNNIDWRPQAIDSARDLHPYSGSTPAHQPLKVSASPTHQWNEYWSSPDPGSPGLGRSSKGSADMHKMNRSNSLKAKLLEAKFESHQAPLRRENGS